MNNYKNVTKSFINLCRIVAEKCQQFYVKIKSFTKNYIQSIKSAPPKKRIFQLMKGVVPIIIFIFVILFAVYEYNVSHPGTFTVSAYFPEGKSEYVDIAPDTVFNGRQVSISIPEELFIK